MPDVMLRLWGTSFVDSTTGGRFDGGKAVRGPAFDLRGVDGERQAVRSTVHVETSSRAVRQVDWRHGKPPE